VKAADLDLEFLLEPRPEGIYVNSFPKLMDKLHGFRLRELVLLTSPSGVGKSTVCSIFASAFMEAGEKLGMIYLEETNKETMQRLIAAKLKVNYLEFKNNPLQVTTKEKIQAAYDEIVNNDQLVMLGHFGSLPVSELMAKIKHMHLVEGCNFIILDHLSLVISGSAVKDERKELDMVMTELAAFCAANDVCIIAVSHINRSAAEQFKAPKLKDGEEPKPYWVQVSKEMMRGSAALEQLSFVIIGLEPEINPDRSRGRVRLTVLKNRPWSYLGVADTFKIDDESWEVLLCEDDFNDVDF
jgi:replicative DNA helicase